MVRYRGNIDSAPVAHAHYEVHIRGYVHEVVISSGSEITARHRRSCDKGNTVFDPMHFFPLLEQKVGALNLAAAFKEIGKTACREKWSPESPVSILFVR
jgi:hypothetical protein